MSSISTSDIVKATFLTIGFFGNIVFFIVLIGRKFQSRPIALLLRHQSIVDGFVCLILFTLTLQPYLWETSSDAVNKFLCHVWHNESVFWFFAALSVQNVVSISIDRYSAICTAERYYYNRDNLICGFFSFQYLYATLAFIIGLFHSRYSHGICQLGLFDYNNSVLVGVVDLYNGLWFITSYLVPIVFFILFYGRSIFVLTKSNIMEGLTLRFSVTVGVIIFFFLVSKTVDNYYYVVSAVNPKYVPTALENDTTFLVAFNSIVNPAIYYTMMTTLQDNSEETKLTRARRSRY